MLDKSWLKLKINNKKGLLIGTTDFKSKYVENCKFSDPA
jgi:hypothetical protein